MEFAFFFLFYYMCFIYMIFGKYLPSSLREAMAYIFGVTPLRPEVGGVVKLAVL
jgi:hypothetical protein